MTDFPSGSHVRMTKLAQALADALIQQPRTVLSNYDIFRLVWEIYRRGEVGYLRGDSPAKENARRPRDILRKRAYLVQDTDYHALWRVTAKPDLPAEDIVCSVDPFCYVSHLSAMQRYGLTNRRPDSLLLTRPAPAERRRMLEEMVEAHLGENIEHMDEEIERPRAIRHPDEVRGRTLKFHNTKYYGEWLQVRGGFARVSTVGQTFLDMVDTPDLCGGIAHVMDTWEADAARYLDEIVRVIDDAAKPIVKVRAGYILDEVLNIKDSRIDAWRLHAQRGSSRVLNPGKPFAPVFSEKWMLSLNV